MKKLASSFLITLVALTVAPAQDLSDIRPYELLDGISAEDEAKGRDLFAKMQQVYGLSVWKKKKRAEFTMSSVWHVEDSGWLTNPQEFKLEAHHIGKDDADLWFLNGPNEGEGWALEAGNHFDLKDGKRIPKSAPDPHTKVIIKNWWFQFPFRITEASVIAYAGDETVEGTKYHRVYATWGSAEPNDKYDQYLLYLDSETMQMDWFYFTHRKANPGARISIKQTDFRTVEGILVPYVSTVRRAVPGKEGVLVHENTYHEIALFP